MTGPRARRILPVGHRTTQAFDLHITASVPVVRGTLEQLVADLAPAGEPSHLASNFVAGYGCAPVTVEVRESALAKAGRDG